MGDYRRMNKTNANLIAAPDLALRPPRSARVRLGGYTILPRVLDKGRAAIAGRQGDYKFGNPVDGLLFEFAGVTADGFLSQLKTGADDVEMLAWLSGQSRRSPAEIANWSAWTETFTDSSVEGRQWLATEVKRLDARRADIHTIFDYLDLEDFVSFADNADTRKHEES